MRIVYLGNNWLGWKVAEYLNQENEEIVCLVLHPPEKRKYGRNIRACANIHDNFIFEAGELSDPSVTKVISELKPDLALSVLFGTILKSQFIGMFPLGVINLHPSYLPYNRGAYPNVWSIVDGTPAGATLHFIDDGVDTGDIIAQTQVPVEPFDTGKSLYKKLEIESLKFFIRTWRKIKAGKFEKKKQTAEGGSFHYVKDIDEIDEIHLGKEYAAKDLLNILRARTFPPHSGAYIRHKEKKIFLKLEMIPERDPEGIEPMIAPIKINNRLVGPDQPAFIIAEMSANHHQKMDEAVKIIQAAKNAGADAIKLQTYTPDTLTIKSDKSDFKVSGGTPWDGSMLYDLYASTYMPWEWQPKLKEIAEDLGLHFFSTPFDPSAVAFLEKLDIPCWKVASFELVDIPLIERIASTEKPIIMSIGMASLTEINDAVQAARNAGADEIALLKCTSAYPATPESMNLRTIPHLSQAFQVPAGLSDHTMGIAVPVAAASLGACIIEKHLTLSRKISGPDSTFSLEPDEFKAMVDAVRSAEKALGCVCYSTNQTDFQSNVFRRSLFFVKDLKTGETISEKNVRSIRPGNGLAPKYLKQIIGRKAATDIHCGTPVSWDLLAG